MSVLGNKLKKFFDIGWSGSNPDYEDDGYFIDKLFRFDERDEEDEEMLESPRKRKPKLNVVSHPSSGLFEVVVCEPNNFEESLEVVNSLRDRKTIVLNLHLLDAEQSQRVVDFISGATHALDGHQQRIGEGVFIFTPANVCISSETEKARVLQEAFWNQAQ